MTIRFAEAPRRGGATVRILVLLAAIAAALIGARAAAQTGGYAVNPARTCGGYPRLPIGMAEGVCAGLVYARPHGPPSDTTVSFPRTVLPLANGDMLIVAMGAWRPGIGSVWRMTLRPGRPPVLRRLLRGLNMPHMAAVGPDGRIYLGEMNRIARFDPDAPRPQETLETVIGDLPSNRLHEYRHPLSAFLFDGDGSLLLNVGAPSDQCDAPPPARGVRCAEGTGTSAAAAIWRYPYLGNGRWSPRRVLLAGGLRNSMALARHPSGTILQGENSIDLPLAESPFDEVNQILPGRFYGWPYCMDVSTPAPAWRAAGAMDCAGPRHTGPAMLLAPHSAPLSMLYYRGDMFPRLRGRLLVSLHGYRGVGARIMAYDVDARGLPVIRPQSTYSLFRGGRAVRHPFPARGQTGFDLTPNWNAVAGVRPFGRPVGLSVAADGAIWVADDRNGTIIRIAADRP
jgi:glucose/arabinose dehydrogenase